MANPRKNERDERPRPGHDEERIRSIGDPDRDDFDDPDDFDEDEEDEGEDEEDQMP